MDQERGQLGRWLLLIVFSFNAVAPVGAGHWLLCFGCDDVGMTLTQKDFGPLRVADPCCESTDVSGDQQQFDRVTEVESLSACDCICIPVESHDIAVVPLSQDGSELALTVLDETAIQSIVHELSSGSITARGPPDAGWLPTTQTLLGQSTSLMI